LATESKTTAAQRVIDHLRHAIVTRELRPGDPVRADVVAEELGISRIPVREALRILEAEGLVLAEPHKGATIAPLGVADLHEIYLLRRLLETEAVMRAAPALNAETLRRMEELIAEMDEVVDAPDELRFIGLNRQFHFALYEACGLPRLTKLISLLWSQSDAYRALYATDPERRRAVQDEHKEIMQACWARDARAAVELIDRHRSRSEAATTALLSTTHTAPTPGA
jgi:DNA-binding GntR family transcriptional regulator